MASGRCLCAASQNTGASARAARAPPPGELTCGMVRCLLYCRVSNVDDVLLLLQQGSRSRATRDTEYNEA